MAGFAKFLSADQDVGDLFVDPEAVTYVCRGKEDETSYLFLQTGRLHVMGAPASVASQLEAIGRRPLLAPRS